MNVVQHPRGNVWRLLKLLCKFGKVEKPAAANKTEKKLQRRSHRTTAFFEMP